MKTSEHPIDIWNSVSLLQFMKKKLTGCDNAIICAPPREILKMFGGCLNIDEFRNKSEDLKEFNHKINIVSVENKIVETCLKLNIEETTHKHVQNTEHNELVLKRNKPIKRANLLDLINKNIS